MRVRRQDVAGVLCAAPRWRAARQRITCRRHIGDTQIVAIALDPMAMARHAELEA
jgi:hypothetical protein